MKILLIGINYTPEKTGIAPYTTAMAEGLLADGHEVKVITGIPHYPQWTNYTGFTGLVRDEVIGGVSVRRVRHWVGGGTGLSRILQEVTFGLMAAVQSWRGADAVLFVSPPLLSTAIGELKARILRRRQPVGVWVQDLYSNGAREIGDSGLASKLLGRVESAVLRGADGVLVIHERFRRHVVDDLGVKDRSVTVSRNWSHLGRGEATNVDALRRRWFGDAAVVAIHTGNMGAKQYLENIVDAARLAARQNKDVVFGLVGNGSRRAALEEYAAGVKNLVFVPSLDDAEYQAVLKSADVLLINEKPGLRESVVPSKLTSYFVQGRPVVAATEADSVTADEIRAADAGPVVAPGKPQAMLDAVLEVAGDADRAARHGRAAIEFAENNFTAASAIARVSGWLESLRRPFA